MSKVRFDFRQTMGVWFERVFDLEDRVVTHAAASTSSPGLLGPDAQKLELALISARAAATLRRILDGMGPDEIDVTILKTAGEMMSEAASALEALASGQTLKRQPTHFAFGTMAYTVELTAPRTDADGLPGYLRSIASSLARLQTSVDRTLAQDLLSVFSILADSATQSAGTMGENSIVVA